MNRRGRFFRRQTYTSVPFPLDFRFPSCPCLFRTPPKRGSEAPPRGDIFLENFKLRAQKQRESRRFGAHNCLCMFVSRFLRMAARSPSPSKRYTIWETEEFVAYLHPFPWTPGATVVAQKIPSEHRGIFQLAERDFLGLLLGARAVGHLLCERLGVQRCALVSRPIVGEPAHIRVLPLHGLDTTWNPCLAEEEDFQLHDPGYCSSKSGPRWSPEDLEKTKARIRAKLSDPDAPASFAFLGDPAHDGLFSRIVRGQQEQWRLWEDDSHVAFLTPFPNTPGFTVLVPRRPLTSDIFRLDEVDYKALILASRKVAQLLQEGLGAQGVALIFEGYEIDYAHAKLIPLLPPPGDSVPRTAPSFCPKYVGYVTSADGPATSMDSLLEMQVKITQEAGGQAVHT